VRNVRNVDLEAMMTKLVSLIAILSTSVAAAACGGGGGPEIAQQQAVSECGGFEAQLRTTADTGYCDAEVLLWSYDSETSTLSLADNRIFLNCCGEHSMVVTEEEGVYVVTETDAPEFGDARCGCMCVFDFTVEVYDIVDQAFDFELVRDVTDSESGPEVVYEGSLDLSEGSGSIVLDETDIGDWCGEGL
jgi:hypothetical protein